MDDSRRDGHYVGRMPRIVSLLALVLLFASPSSAHGQLASERVEGLYRVCNYGSYLSVPAPGAVVRDYRVGLAQNCPPFPPGADPSRPAPPTAQLSSEVLRDGTRFCLYRQAGGEWTIPIEASLSCPLSAGMTAEMTMQRNNTRRVLEAPRRDRD